MSRRFEDILARIEAAHARTKDLSTTIELAYRRLPAQRAFDHVRPLAEEHESLSEEVEVLRRQVEVFGSIARLSEMFPRTRWDRPADHLNGPKRPRSMAQAFGVVKKGIILRSRISRAALVGVRAR
jgi:hypothetical protein